MSLPQRRFNCGMLLVLAVLGLCGPRAWAAPESQTILVFVEDADGALAHRMRAEFVALGFEVNLQSTETVGQRSLEEHARTAHAIAAIRVEHNDIGVEMSIMDRATGKTTSRSISIPSGSEPPAPELVVLRTVELLRASLLELEAPHPNRGDVPPGPKVRALLPPRPAASKPSLPEPSSFSLAGGVDARQSKGVTAGLDLHLSADFRPFGTAPLLTRFGLRLPLSPMRVTAPEGTSDLSALSVYGALLLNTGRPPTRAFADLGFGAAADWLTAHGTPSGGYAAQAARGLVISPVLLADAGIRIGFGTALRLDGAVGCTVPAATLRFDDRDVIHWACPWYSAGGSAVIHWR